MLIFIFLLLNQFSIFMEKKKPMEFDAYHEIALSTLYTTSEGIPSQDPFRIFIDGNGIINTKMLPFFSLCIFLVKIFTNLNPFSSYIILSLFILFGICLFVYLIVKKISGKNYLGFLSIIVFLSIPYLLLRFQTPTREFLNLFFLSFLIYLIVLLDKKNIKIKYFFLISFILILCSFLSYPLFWVIYIVIILLYFLVKLRIKKLIYGFLILIIFLLMLNNLIFYLNSISFNQIISFNQLIDKYSLIVLVCFIISFLFIIKLLTLKDKIISNKLALFLVCLIIPLLITICFDSTFTNRINLYLSFFISIFVVFFIKLIRKNYIPIIISILIVSSFHFPPNLNVWINDNEINDSIWINNNLEENSVIITQRGMTYLILPYAQRKTAGHELNYYGSDTNIKNKILKYYNLINDNLGEQIYLYISKDKLNSKRNEQSFWSGLNLNEFLKDSRFIKVYESDSGVIFKIIA